MYLTGCQKHIENVVRIQHVKSIALLFGLMYALHLNNPQQSPSHPQLHPEVIIAF